MHPGSDFISDEQKNILWNKLKYFDFDNAGSQIKYSNKLAAINNWSEIYTQRVIEEYRKFIFLCCISPSGAAPSKIVDEAWHLHLTYTSSYWIKLCKNTLGIDLHHYPSMGGKGEMLKYEKLYKDTLWLYEQIFGVNPPRDIWSQPKKAKLKINTSEVSLSISNKLQLILLIGLPFLFIKWWYNIIFPFNLNGPQFLLFYALICISAAYSFHIIYNNKIKRIRLFIQRHFPDDVSIFQLAEFLGGKKRSVQAAILDLLRKDLLTVEPDNVKLKINLCKLLAGDQNPLLIPVSNEYDGKEVDYKEIENLWYRKTNYSHPALDKIKEVIAGVKFHAPYLPVIIALLGFARMMEGMLFNYPILYLFLEIIVFSFVIFKVYASHHHSKSNVVSGESIAMFKKNQPLYSHVEDPEVTEFVLTGKMAPSGYRERILGEIFLISAINQTNYDSGGSDGGSGCGGSGCGGGGCGGCGGCGGG